LKNKATDDWQHYALTYSSPQGTGESCPESTVTGANTRSTQGRPANAVRLKYVQQYKALHKIQCKRFKVEMRQDSYTSSNKTNYITLTITQELKKHTQIIIILIILRIIGII